MRQDRAFRYRMLGTFSSPCASTMAIHSVGKTLLNRTIPGMLLAFTTVFAVGCSHAGHQLDAATSANAEAAAGTAQTDETQSKSAHEAHDATGHAHGNESAPQAKGVNTNHDVFHSKSIEVPAGTAVPAVTVRVEEDTVRGWNLYVGTANFSFEPTKVNGESRPTEGHAHLYINDESMQRIYGTWTHLPTLPGGTNEVRVTLNANGHETLTTQGTPIEDSITVEVYDPDLAN